MPSSSAELLIIHNALPLNERTDPTALLVEETVLEMKPRVCGGIMSRKAYKRSPSVSSLGSYSDSSEISESKERPIASENNAYKNKYAGIYEQQWRKGDKRLRGTYLCL